MIDTELRELNGTFNLILMELREINRNMNREINILLNNDE